MSDLNELQAALTTKLAGATSIGSETNFVNASANGDLQASDILNASVVQGSVSVSVAGAPVELRVGASPLVNRKAVIFQVQGTNVVYGFSSGSQPFITSNNDTVTLAIGPNVSVFVDRSSGSGSVTVAFAEFA